MSKDLKHMSISLDKNFLYELSLMLCDLRFSGAFDDETKSVDFKTLTTMEAFIYLRCKQEILRTEDFELNDEEKELLAMYKKMNDELAKEIMKEVEEDVQQ